MKNNLFGVWSFEFRVPGFRLDRIESLLRAVLPRGWCFIKLALSNSKLETPNCWIQNTATFDPKRYKLPLTSLDKEFEK